ncbi:MAG: SDR family NAD(P)-dependent oxidoreductase [Kiritimatiellae bacterium]|nr:SDR family NAD(P)-dependent oxidoreductase [Kiritimatiellia bacterium]
MLTIDLKDRPALVVGGSRGIGAGITAALCAAGAPTVFTHTGRPAAGESVAELVRQIRVAGGDVADAAVDAHDAAGMTALTADIVRRHGKLGVLVFNVGQNPPHSVAETTVEEWKRIVDLNLTTAFYAVRAALPHMLREKFGRIILIGSSAVYSGGGGAMDYAAAKAGLTGIMTYLCKTHTRDGILTNIIHPCTIRTDLLNVRYPDDKARAALAAQIPAGRLGRPDDIAGLAAYLASPWGDFICGQSILVDGGRTLFR